MKKIRYNIAKNKKIDSFRFSIFSTGVLIISILFFVFGIKNLSHNTKKRQKDLTELRQFKSRLDDISSKSEEYNRKINEIRSKWNKQVLFSNLLISKKSFSFLNKLNALEDLLPEGVSINEIKMSNDSKSIVQMNIVAYPFSKSVDIFKRFSKFNLYINDEKEVDGTYRANLTIKINDEKN